MSRPNSREKETFYRLENRDREIEGETNIRVDSLDINLIIDVIDDEFLRMDDRPLGTAEILILEGIWQNKTYRQIALEENYSPDYFTNVVAPKLLSNISKLIDGRITKKNCRLRLTKYVREKILGSNLILLKRKSR